MYDPVKEINDLMSNQIEKREKLLCEENELIDQMHNKKQELWAEIDANYEKIKALKHTIRNYDNYKARMKKYEWIDNLLQTTTQFFRYLLPNRFQ